MKQLDYHYILMVELTEIADKETLWTSPNFWSENPDEWSCQ